MYTSITYMYTHPTTPPAPPALGHTRPHTVVAHLDRSSVGYLKMFLVILEQLVGLSRYVPRPRGRPVLGTINQLT